MSAIMGHSKAFVALAQAFAEHSREVMEDAKSCDEPRIAARIADRAMLLSSLSVVYGTAATKLDALMTAEASGPDNREARG